MPLTFQVRRSETFMIIPQRLPWWRQRSVVVTLLIIVPPFGGVLVLRQRWPIWMKLLVLLGAFIWMIVLLLILLVLLFQPARGPSYPNVPQL